MDLYSLKSISVCKKTYSQTIHLFNNYCKLIKNNFFSATALESLSFVKDTIKLI